MGYRDTMKHPPWASRGGRVVQKMTLGGLGLRPYASRQLHRLVCAVLELDGHENHFAIAEVFQIVHLELALAIGLVARLAGLIRVFNGRSIVHVLEGAPAQNRGPEIVEHVAVET